MVSLIVAFLVLYSFFINQLCSATDEDIISHNKILRDGETIVSNGGIYALGFFSPGKSKLRYVGIWYKKIPKQTVVWVANRNNPINTSSSGVAKVDERGNLGIFNGMNSSTPVWATNISKQTNSDKNTSLFYKLLDSGNLVLGDGESINKGDFLWQSFDFPTDTRLPEMKIGFNLKTGMNWSLTSWKSSDDPSTGDFTYSMDRTGLPEISIKKGQQKMWRTGPWNGQGWNGIPADTVSTSSFVNGRDGTYTIGHNTSLPFRLYMDESGIARRAMWFQGEWTVVWSAPQESCDNYGKCGVFGICSISNNAQICSCLPGYEPKSPTDLYLKNGSQGCVRKRELFCGKGDGFLKLARMKLPDTSNTRVDMSLGIKDCEMECRNNCSCTGYTSADVNGSGCMAWFGDLTDMREFTQDKGDKTCLFVLMQLSLGKLSDGREIAVKRLSKNSGQGVIEFKNEVVLIAKLQHRNLVQILGCCVEEEEKMLVYEFMPNKSLDFLLFDPTRSTSLDWGLRRDIILGIARGVLYLHQDSRLRIIHRDLKASNVLLDAEMNPKISDFGMARIFGGNQTQGNTNRVVGTFGYMSPEYAMDGLFSTKSDVFSFGVLSLEIISGKKNTGFYCEDPLMNLIKHAWELWRDGRPLELVDSAIGTSFPEQEVVKFIQVGILCVQEKANDRPTMSSAFLMLSNETTIPNPAEPAFILPRNLNHPNSSSSMSANEMSTTIVEGR
ncbi:hypothetical protein Syun_027150 [Stephania yunnanensis]|uniref:Receptor-like serine/threonine-protein kinase n=1 Tax=Stephania yunnanensis TaxID=152371 RepID=A0AAP0EFG0_9MAGN